jgi:ferredoxin/flavodoxin---NADP+ reductase
MYEITRKETLSPLVRQYTIRAPYVTRHAEPGQFVIIRVSEDGERVPMTIHAADKTEGTVTIIVQTVGATTIELDHLKAGDHLADVVGPLGKPTDISGVSRALVVGGGLGSAIAWPVAKALKEQGAMVDTVLGFRSRDLVILEDAFKDVSNRLFVMTDDGTYGQKGFVTDMMKTLIQDSRSYDKVYAIGPLVMMKHVSLLTKPFGIPTIVSMNPVMVDGTGMCGGCRLSVGGKTVFACVDGPDFDGHQVDFDEAINRASVYNVFEKTRREEACRLFKVNLP